jgi:hypothetical protein
MAMCFLLAVSVRYYLNGVTGLEYSATPGFANGDWANHYHFAADILLDHRVDHSFWGPYPISLNATDVPIADLFRPPIFYPPMPHVLLGTWLFVANTPSLLGIGPVRACILWASILDSLVIVPVWLIVRRFGSLNATLSSALLWTFNGFSLWAFRWGGLGVLTIGFFTSVSLYILARMLSETRLSVPQAILYAGVTTLTLCAAFLSHLLVCYLLPIMGLTILVLACTSVERRKVSVLVVSFLTSIGLAFVLFYSYAFLPMLQSLASTDSTIIGGVAEVFKAPSMPLFPAPWYWALYGGIPLLLTFASPVLIRAYTADERTQILPVTTGFFGAFFATQLSAFVPIIARVQFLTSLYSTILFGVVYSQLGAKRRFIVLIWCYIVLHSLFVVYAFAARLVFDI